MNVLYDPAHQKLTFSELLPGIERHSDMHRELKQFLHTRSSRAVPAHRRIDPRKANVTLGYDAGKISLIVSLNPSHLEYGVRKAVNLIHELFVTFLRRPMYFDYMVEHFHLDPDA